MSKKKDRKTLKRDELGRFARAKKSTIRRDDLGRFASAKKPTRKPVKRVSSVVRPRVSPVKAKPRKTVPVKAEPREVLLKKAPPRKALPARAKPEKTVPVKAKPRKVPPRKKRIPPKKKLPVKKAPPKKTVPVKAKPSKVLPKKVPTRKAPPARAKPEKTVTVKDKPRKVPPRKVPPRKKRIPPKKKLPGKKAPPRKKRRRRGELPLLAERSRQAEAVMQDRLVQLQDGIAIVEPGLDMAIQTFVNLDGTVDGELRVSSLPAEWREVEGVSSLVMALSSALRTFDPFPARPAMGGAFWAAFGIRFGPQNETEIGELADLYKRFRGLFQIGTYPTPAWNTGPLQLALVGDTVGLRAMIENLMEKRGLPPTVVLIRFIWTPDGKRPGHYQGEK